MTDDLAAEATRHLRWLFGMNYIISRTEDGVFHALSRSLPVADLSAATAAELETMIRADYQKRRTAPTDQGSL